MWWILYLAVMKKITRIKFIHERGKKAQTRRTRVEADEEHCDAWELTAGCYNKPSESERGCSHRDSRAQLQSAARDLSGETQGEKRLIGGSRSRDRKTSQGDQRPRSDRVGRRQGRGRQQYVEQCLDKHGIKNPQGRSYKDHSRAEHICKIYQVAQAPN